MAIAAMSVMPVTVQASDDIKTVESAQETVVEIIDESMKVTVTKYATCETGIFLTPDETTIPCDYSMLNTTFEVVIEADGWAMVTTEDGFAYIKSKNLSEIPIEIKSYTEDELYVMAHVLAGEAQSCNDNEQRYVGSVVLNRVAHPEFPNTIRGVVFQSGQYACTYDGNFYREPTASNWANAKWLLENGSVFPANVIWQSGGRQGKGVYLKTAYHYYCY